MRSPTASNAYARAFAAATDRIHRRVRQGRRPRGGRRPRRADRAPPPRGLALTGHGSPAGRLEGARPPSRSSSRTSPAGTSPCSPPRDGRRWAWPSEPASSTPPADRRAWPSSRSRRTSSSPTSPRPCTRPANRPWSACSGQPSPCGARVWSEVKVTEGPMDFAHHAIGFAAYGTVVRLVADAHQPLEPRMVLPLDDPVTRLRRRLPAGRVSRAGRCHSMAPVPTDLMTAAVYVGDGRIEVEQVPVPEPRPGELLVNVSECGICGSDLHLVLERYARPGAILGHEWSGTVASAADAGPGWTGGERVVFNPSPGCGACRPCRRGRPSVCVHRATGDMRDMRGAFAQYITVPATNTLRIPDSLGSRAAALVEPTAIALHAVAAGRRRRRRSGPGHRGRSRRSHHRGRAPGPGRGGHHRQRTGGACAAPGPSWSGHPGPSSPTSWRTQPSGGRCDRPLCGGLRVLGPGRCRRAGVGPARLRRCPGVRGHRCRADPGEPQPDDHPRAHRTRHLQLQRTTASSRRSICSTAGRCRSRRSSRTATCR